MSMNVTRIAKAPTHIAVTSEGFHASTEETLLHSYDRFYKAVNKLCKDVDVQSVPRLETVLGPSVKLPKERAKQLRRVWESAEKFTQVHGVVQKFQRYRHDLAKKARRRSRTASLTSELEDSTKEMYRHGQKLEDRMDRSDAALTTLEAKLDRLPSVMSEAIEKLRSDQDEAVRTTLRENRKQMERLEQWLQNLDAKLSKFGDSKGNANVKLTCVGWPEMMHNNIVYSSSESSSLHGALTSDLTIGESVHDATVAVQLDDPTPEQRRLPSVTTSKQKLRMHLEARPVDSSEPTFDEETINRCRLAKTSKSTSTSFTPTASLLSSFNKDHHSSESGQRETTIFPADDAFDEAFLRDVMRVQENIQSSDLGRPPSERDTSIHPPSSTCSDVSPSTVPIITENKDALPVSSFVAYRMESVSFLDSALTEICLSEPHSPTIPHCHT